MVSREINFQIDMFSGEYVDTRTDAQKKRVLQAEQLEMFPSREVAQFGVNPRPLMDLSPFTKLTLQVEDPRSEEEKERDRQRAAEKLTQPMFVGEDPDTPTTPFVVEYVVWNCLEELLLHAFW